MRFSRLLDILDRSTGVDKGEDIRCEQQMKNSNWMPPASHCVDCDGHENYFPQANVALASATSAIFTQRAFCEPLLFSACQRCEFIDLLWTLGSLPDDNRDLIELRTL